jgi:hypothetical protein
VEVESEVEKPLSHSQIFPITHSQKILFSRVFLKESVVCIDRKKTKTPKRTFPNGYLSGTGG